MKVLVMYESMFGNSERVARAVASGLEEGNDVVIRDVTTAEPGDMPADVDLLIAGGPTHAVSMSGPVGCPAQRPGARPGCCAGATPG